jgi:hypothetical protein
MNRISLLLLTCALILSGVAAYYSIIGLATIFSSAFWPVVIMAAMLEISKLVLASWLYHNWHITPKLLKAYLTSAVIVLMMITSLGIFGFLSKAFLDQNLITSEATLRLELIHTEIQSVQQIRSRYEQQLAQLDRSIDIQLNANRAQGALAARRRQQAERTEIRQRLDTETVRWTELNQERTRLQQQVNVIASEVGPIRYVAQLFTNREQVDLESAVTWMIVVIVMVFDPLAVLMIVAANMSLGRRPISVVTNVGTPTHPVLGTVKWNAETADWSVYTPEGWKMLPVNLVNEISQSGNTPELQAALAEALDAWLQRSLSVQHTVDPNLIRDTVAETIRNIWHELSQTTTPQEGARHWGVQSGKNI